MLTGSLGSSGDPQGILWGSSGGWDPHRILRGSSGGPNPGLVAVAGADPHGRDPALYSARCPHLRPRLWQLGAPLDLGFLGRWWLLEEALRDSDINEEEFGHLPERLRRLEPRELRSERNERLHRERLRAVVLSEEEMRE
ncbi:mitochondrial import inner membrane translocase subunit Tim29-like [Poecile atricapillus]|uniref:mitochondrial import inner membrane translocase subunit Tim29-like n=1 Tax=Poecile atricapillus TaxID=48891 RepID=UPI002739069F|nr:mitochondrial import inner membrane translocase subunit Tim29-like [Poecile atricapillus]